MKQSPGIRHLSGLKVGTDELQWLQAANHRLQREARRAGMDGYGLILPITSDGWPSGAWEVTATGTAGELSLGRASIVTGNAPNTPVESDLEAPSWAVDGEGYIFGFPADDDFVIPHLIPDDSTWYTIWVARDTSEYEPGTLQVFAGSNVLTGTNTKFTRYAGKTTDGFDRGSNVRIDAGDTVGGNAGTYEIDTVVSDTSATLVTNINGANESDVPFTMAGDFFDAIPADPDIHRNPSVEVTVTAQLKEPGDYTRIPVADVKRTGGTIQVVDRRTHMIYRQKEPVHQSVCPALVAKADETGALTRKITSLVANATGMSVCEAHGTVAQTDGDTFIVGNIRTGASVGDAATQVWDPSDADPSVWAPVQLEAATNTALALVHVPYLNRTVGIYAKGGILSARISVDNGVTWSAGTTVIDPTLVDPLDTADFPFGLMLRNGRLGVWFELYDDSAGTTTINFVYSDDYGDSWHNNGGAGWQSSDAAAGDLFKPHAAQGRDGRIWLVAEDDGGPEVIRVHLSDDGLGTEAPYDIVSQELEPEGGGAVADETHYPTVWVAPNGQAIVMASYWTAADTSESITAWVCSVYTPVGGSFVRIEQRIDDFLVLDAAGGSAALRHYARLVQSRNGILRLFYVSGAMVAVPLTVQQTPRTPAMFGKAGL